MSWYKLSIISAINLIVDCHFIRIGNKAQCITSFSPPVTVMCVSKDWTHTGRQNSVWNLTVLLSLLFSCCFSKALVWNYVFVFWLSNDLWHHSTQYRQIPGQVRQILVELNVSISEKWEKHAGTAFMILADTASLWNKVDRLLDRKVQSVLYKEDLQNKPWSPLPCRSNRKYFRHSWVSSSNVLHLLK